MLSSATADLYLRLLLRVIGGIELLAIPFIVLPLEQMAFIHDRVLGQGPMPEGKVVEYMARSLSVMYAVHGAVVMFLSHDVARYRPLIVYLGILHIVLGICTLATDVAVGWPWWWCAMEGPGILVGGALTIWLARAGGRARESIS